MRLLTIALGGASLLVAHAAVVSRSGPLTLVSLAVLALLVMLPRLARWHRDMRFPGQRYRNVFDFLRHAATVGPRVAPA